MLLGGWDSQTRPNAAAEPRAADRQSLVAGRRLPVATRRSLVANRRSTVAGWQPAGQPARLFLDRLNAPDRTRLVLLQMNTSLCGIRAGRVSPFIVLAGATCQTNGWLPSLRRLACERLIYFIAPTSPRPTSAGPAKSRCQIPALAPRK